MTATHRDIFVLSWKWLDIPTSAACELHLSLDKAEASRDTLIYDETKRKSAFGDIESKLQIVIDRYNFDVECDRRVC
jgi:hypothetical protein